MTPNPFYFSLKQIKAHGSTNNKFPTIGSHQIKSRSHIQNEAIAIHIHPYHQLNSSSKSYKRSSTTAEVACYAFKLFTSLGDKPSQNIDNIFRLVISITTYFSYSAIFISHSFYFNSYSFIFMKNIYFFYFSNFESVLTVSFS